MIPAAAAIAALSQGASTSAVVAWVARTLGQQCGPIPTLVDVGCGQADLCLPLRGQVQHYIGLDVVRYPALAERPWVDFRAGDLNAERFPLEDGCADACVSVETIEHLENPRALMRELVRMARPGGLVMVTTPNQLSGLSKLSLLVKNEFTAFQEAPGLYPTHITALLAGDLRHIGQECGLTGLEIHYSGVGRLPGSSRHYPAWMSRRWARGASDNVMLLGRKAGA